MGFLFLVQLLSLLGPVIAAPTAGPILPINDTFYVPPKGFESTAPGTILRSRNPPKPIAAFSSIKENLDAAHQLLFRSTDTFGKPIAAVSTILVPHNADYTKLLSYQVAEDAANPNCAPSYAFQLESANDGPLGLILPQAELVLITTALQRGWVVTVPDHLGTKSAFLANKLSGHIVLDNVRAALASSDLTKIASHPTVALWGYSGGSLASGFAAELQPDYAPELDISGAALGGTVPSIPPVINATNKGLFSGLLPAGIQGLANEYPDIAHLVDISIYPEKKAAFEKVKSKCLSGDILEYFGQDIYSYTSDPHIFTSDIALPVLNENAMGHSTPDIPLLIYKSGGDEVSPVNDTDSLVTTYCDAGARVEYKRDEFSEHASLAILGVPDAVIWLDDRMNGKPVDKGCSKSTELTSLLDPKSLAVLGESLVQTLLSLLEAPVGPILIG